MLASSIKSWIILALLRGHLLPLAVDTCFISTKSLHNNALSVKTDDGPIEEDNSAGENTPMSELLVPKHQLQSLLDPNPRCGRTASLNSKFDPTELNPAQTGSRRRNNHFKNMVRILGTWSYVLNGS